MAVAVVKEAAAVESFRQESIYTQPAGTEKSSGGSTVQARVFCCSLQTRRV